MPMAATLRCGCTVLAEHPDARAALDAGGLDAEVAADLDQRLLEPSDVADHVERLGQLDDRVADELAGTVPGDLAAAVDIDDRCAVDRPLEVERALAGGVDRRVLEQQNGVGRLVRGSGLPGGAAAPPTPAHSR